MITNFWQKPEIITPTVKERKTYPKRKIFILFLILLITLGLIWFLFYSPFFKIKNIIIEEAQANEQLTLEVEHFKGKNIFLFSLKSEEQNLILKQPEIKSISIWKGLPDTLKLKLKLREKVLVWQTLDKFYLVDEQGIAFKERGPISEGENVLLITDSRLIPVKLGNQILAPAFVQFVEKLGSDFPAQTSIKLNSLEIEETTFQVTAKTSEGFKVYFDTTRPLEPQLLALKKVLAEHRQEVKEYIDVRVKGWAYYK